MAVVAQRYARALLELLAESNNLLEARDRLAHIAEAATGEADARQLWLAPQVSMAHKTELLEKLLAAVHASPIVHDFCRHLLAKRRFAIIDQIAREFDRLCRERLDQASAVIYTPRSIEAVELDRLKKQLSKRVGKTVTCEVQIDPQLIGGIKIRLENTVIDASVAGMLATARTALAESALPRADAPVDG